MAKTNMDTSVECLTIAPSTCWTSCHLQNPGWIILAVFLNVKCCYLRVHHHHHIIIVTKSISNISEYSCHGFRLKSYLRK